MRDALPHRMSDEFKKNSYSKAERSDALPHRAIAQRSEETIFKAALLCPKGIALAIPNTAITVLLEEIYWTALPFGNACNPRDTFCDRSRAKPPATDPETSSG